MKIKNKIYKTRSKKNKKFGKKSKIKKKFGGSNNLEKMTLSKRNAHWDDEFKLWNKIKHRESSSGVGSTKYNCKNTIKTLENVVKKYNINSIIDIACGDMNWIVDFLNINKYIKDLGVDIADSLIKRNKIKYPNLRFLQKDVLTEDLKIDKYDLILCKDLLFHLLPNQSLQILKNLKKINANYLLTSYFPDSNTNYIDYKFDNGAIFYNINLNKEPFLLPNPIEKFKEVEKSKYLGLWSSKDL